MEFKIHLKTDPHIDNIAHLRLENLNHNRWLKHF